MFHSTATRRNLQIALLACVPCLARPSMAQVQIPLPNAGFEEGPQTNHDPYPVGTSLSGGWIVFPGAAAYWGVERRTSRNNCFGFSSANSGSYGVLLGSVNQGGMTQAGIELLLPSMPEGRLYEFRVYVRAQIGQVGFNPLEMTCGGSQRLEAPTMDWREVAVRGNAITNSLRLRLKAALLPDNNNSCWAPIVDDVSLFDVGPDCDHNLIPDALDPDCNGNGIPDACDLASGFSVDYDHDGIPDECGCAADLNDDGMVNGSDLAILLAFWGTVSTFPRADIDRDQIITGSDLAILLAAWGICPN